MDVSSLYTSIPHDGALQALKYFLDKREDCSIFTATLLRLTEFVLNMNTFQFNRKFYCQMKGVAMGTKMGPSIACLFLGYLEELMFALFKRTTPILYKRYIDDIIGAASCTLQELKTFIVYQIYPCHFWYSGHLPWSSTIRARQSHRIKHSLLRHRFS